MRDIALKSLTPPVINNFLDKFKGSKSHGRKTLAAAWSWGGSRLEKIPANPMAEVDPATSGSRVDIYITDDEYEAMYEFVDTYWKAMMEFAYICRARRSELQNMKRDQLLEAGVQLKRGKGSWGEITMWTPRLRDALALLDDYNSGREFDYVFGAPAVYKGKGTRMTPGRRIGKDTLDTQWRNLKEAAKGAGVMVRNWNFHDIKAKGITDHKELVSGHKTLSAKLVYIRKTMEVEGTR